LLGGPDVNAQFFNYDLVDEIFLTVEPLLLDGGLNLVGELEESVSLALNEVSLLGNGSSVLFHYVVEK
jgi:dihydrofolate reductase